MKKKLVAIVTASFLAFCVTAYGDTNTQNTYEPTQETIIYDGDITYFQMKEIIVENFLYTLDIAKHKESLQEAEDMYDKYSFEALEKAIKTADDRLNTVSVDNQLQIVECLNMQMELTRCMSNLIVKGA